MRKFVAPLFALMLAFAVLVPGSAVVAREKEKPVRFNVKLTGAAEKPTPGDPDGKGKAKLWLYPESDRICYELKVRKIEPAQAAHIHEITRPDGTGPVRVPLEAPSDGRSEGCVSATNERIMDIINNPSKYYVNVHNTPYPGGAVRGDLK